MSTLTIYFPAEINSVTLYNNNGGTLGTVTNHNGQGSINYYSDVKIQGIALAGGYLSVSGSLNWSNTSGGTYTFGSVSNGTITIFSRASQEPISHTGNRSITLGFVYPEVYQWTITYYKNDGSGTSATQRTSSGYSTGQTATLLRSSYWTYEGQYISEWNTRSDGSGVSYTPDTEYTFHGNITLYAIWIRINQYTITYNKNDGSGATTTQQTTSGRESGQTLTLLRANYWVRENYEFRNWNTQADGAGVAYSADTNYTFYSDTTLYAIWKPLYYYYRVHYFPQNGIESDGYLPGPENAFPTMDSTPSFSLNGMMVPTRKAGYNFDGWALTSGATQGHKDYIVLQTTSRVYENPQVNNIYGIWIKRNESRFTWSGDDVSDSTLFQKGKKISSALTAARWNALLLKLKTMIEANGGTFNYTQVSTNQEIKANGTSGANNGYNDVLTAIGQLPNHGTLPATKSRGDSVLASLFINIGGSANIKDALNAAIDYYNDH